MKTTNWQTKALTLFIAIAALWLTTACVEEYTGPEIITPSAPCGPEVPLTPSKEYFTWEGAKVSSEYEKMLEAAKNPRLLGIEDPEGRERFIHGMRMAARDERLKPEKERIDTILFKYRDRIRWQWLHQGGHVHGIAIAGIENANGELTDKLVIEITVTEYVDQSTLLPEARIPECMDGVEVHFRVMPEMTIE